MTIPRWLLLIAVMVGVGAVQVSQHNALWLQGYAVGKQTQRIHALEGDVSWLNAQVIGLASPARLADVAQERHLNLVAWATLTPRESLNRTSSASTVDSEKQGSARRESDPLAVAADDTLD